MRTPRPEGLLPRRSDPTALVLGATGRVGSVVTSELLALGVTRVIAGSRTADPERVPAGAEVLGVDIGDRAAVGRALSATGCDVVVLCVEPAGTAVHRASLEAGVSIVDVCATADQLVRIEELACLAANNGAAVLLSIGLAPGLTNCLAAQVASDLDGLDRLDLTVLLGAGESHGADAVRWTVEALTREPLVRRPGAARASLPGFGRRQTYPMPFSDQFTLRRTLGVPSVTTRMCLDSRAVSTALFSLAATRGGRRLLRSPAARRFLTASSGRLPIGSDRFLVMAEGQREGRRRQRWASGSGQSRTTGLVAALAAKALLDGVSEAGVWHLEQVPDLMTRLSTLSSSGVRFGAR